MSEEDSAADRRRLKRNASSLAAYHKHKGDPEFIAKRAEYERARNKTSKRRKSKKAARRKHLLSKYALTPEQYSAMATQQGNRCALCGTDSPAGNGVLHVDHCHATGVVRGLLCMECNTGIGKLQDSPALLRQAASYIESYQQCPS
jgi:hypothetical protein